MVRVLRAEPCSVHERLVRLLAPVAQLALQKVPLFCRSSLVPMPACDRRDIQADHVMVALLLEATLCCPRLP
eukprot:9188478-Pyramimonas_sp.AAC.1